MHGTKADYDYGYMDYDDSFEGLYEDDHEGENEDHDYGEEDAYGIGDTSETSKDPSGKPPTVGPQNQKFTPMCNKENCWIRVDWEPPPRDTWMSCLLRYRVGYTTAYTTGSADWIWMSDEGTYVDLRSEERFFFDEAEGTNHSLTIRNLDYETDYEVVIDVFNPYGRRPGRYPGREAHEVSTPPGPCVKVTSNL